MGCFARKSRNTITTKGAYPRIYYKKNTNSEESTDSKQEA
jgi:hypothetical protein